MKIAVISITENGRKISAKIAENLGYTHDLRRFAIEKFSDENAKNFTDLKAVMAEIFYKFEGIIFVCACGIAVRMIAPYVVSKVTDPAVVAVDESGKFAVPLLSGHIGGANALAEKIAAEIGAISVITTATDAGEKFSPDSFAVANNLHICEYELAKECAAAIVNEEKIGFYSDYDYKNFPADYFTCNAKIGICISCDTVNAPFEKTLHLVPKNISMGIGCKKNTPVEQFMNFVTANLAKNNIPIYRIKRLCTIDLKCDEKAICEFSKRYKIPAEFFSADELMGAEGEFSPSDFVKKITGADNVCERAAAIGGGKIIVPKTAENGITFALAEENFTVDFERKIL